MKNLEFRCPNCGLEFDWDQDLPSSLPCGACKSAFEPVHHILRFLLIVHRPGTWHDVWYEYKSNAPFSNISKGDWIHPESISIREDKAIRVGAIEHEFTIVQGIALHAVHIHPKVVDAPSNAEEFLG